MPLQSLNCRMNQRRLGVRVAYSEIQLRQVGRFIGLTAAGLEKQRLRYPLVNTGAPRALCILIVQRFGV